MYMAFLLREHPFEGWDERKTLLLALVVGAAGLGNTVGVLVGSVLKTRKPEATVVVVLLADVAVLVLAAVTFSLPTAVALGLTVGVCQSLGKLSLDALIQRDIPETVRSSAFARSETLLQLSWVVGGFLGIALPLDPARLSLSIVAGLLLVWTAVVMRGLLAQRRRAAAA
jgi:predicted MFS family arabinose efflux permease